MPTLDWIGKSAVVNHHQDVPYRLLNDNPALSAGSLDTGNLLVQGDNLESLRALLPYYAGQVKCIYIDPPYNTGNENWIYNDNVNSPEIRRWLGQVVGDEAGDLSRHDKWLCMMYPRLKLLHQFLREDGAIFISIDDNELSHLRAIMDDIFSESNFVECVTWQKKVSPANDAKWFSGDHEHVLIYAKRKSVWRPHRLARNEKQRGYYRNPDGDPRGDWNSVAYTCNKSKNERPNLYYSLIHPLTGQEVWPKETAVWAYSKEVYEQHRKDNLLYWGAEGTAKAPRYKKFLSDAGNIVPRSIWSYDDVGHTQEAMSEFLSLFPEGGFATPKPTRLIKRILQIATDGDSLVLDSFAGSGTTGHAVMQMNKEDNGTRRSILIEIDPYIAQNITIERLRRVICGYRDIPGLGGGFRYATLGEPLFDAFGRIGENVTYSDLANHIYFSQHQSSSPECLGKGPLIGRMNGIAYYLLWTGHGTESVLTNAVLRTLPPHDGPKVVYADCCHIGNAHLKAAGVVFKQVPYKVQIS